MNIQIENLQRSKKNIYEENYLIKNFDGMNDISDKLSCQIYKYIRLDYIKLHIFIH